VPEGAVAEQKVEQLDWYQIADARAAIDREFTLAVARLSEFVLARHTGEDPSLISKRMNRVERRQPTADMLIVAFVLDQRLQEVAAGQVGKLLVAPRDLTADEALRLLFVKAQAGWDRRALAEVAEVLSRVGKNSSWEEQAKAHGWRAAE
jgi:hypothetical protein